MSTAPEKGAAYQELVAGREFVVLDIETTHTKATKTADAAFHPISVGAVVLLNGTRRETFHRLANPGVPVDKDSSAYNGIRTADLAGQPDVATVLAELDGFLARHPDAALVCHNALFDVGHLAAAYARAGMAPSTGSCLTPSSSACGSSCPASPTSPSSPTSPPATASTPPSPSRAPRPGCTRRSRTPRTPTRSLGFPS